jgi:dTDP-4-amino-4,6-dideoxygalactose transaminase
MSTETIIHRSIPFHVPCLEQEEIDEVVDTLRSGWITTGPKTARFEQAFSRYVGCEHSIAVNSCTAALHLSLAASGIGPGDEVITTPYTFAATAGSIMHTGARPVLVDIEENGFNIDACQIERAITPRTRAIMPVHFAGQACDMDRITDIARRHNLIVVEDAAHAIGSEYRGRKVGNIGHLTAFSFYATKNLTVGEGGMVTTNDGALAERIRSLSLHGLNRDAWKRYSSVGNWYYEVHHLGFKCNLSDIQSAIGLHQLAKLDRFIEARQRIVERYDEAFQDLDAVRIPPKGASRHAWHLYVIRVRQELLKNNRAEIISRLAEAGIGASVHFIPVHLHPYFRDTFGWKMGDFPRAEETYEGAISLPLYPQLESNGTLAHIIDTVRKTISDAHV